MPRRAFAPDEKVVDGQQPLAVVEQSLGHGHIAHTFEPPSTRAKAWLAS